MVAKELGISMEMVSIKPTDSFTNPNASLTGGSMGSECNCSVSLIIAPFFLFGNSLRISKL